MKRPSLTQKLATQVLVLLGLFSQACPGISTTAGQAATCNTNTAQIQVNNGQMLRLCGCSEGTGTFANGSSLTCTVPAGTQVYFNFVSISTSREFTVSQLQPCPLFQPQSYTQTCTVLMNFTGTFNFSDYQGSGAVGQIIVQ